jgi:hypothetical protein
MIIRLAEMAQRAGSKFSLSLLIFLGNFTIAKVVVFLLPLIVAAMATEQLYGSFELALAIGLQAVAIILGAPLSGTTQLYLIRKVGGFAGPLLLLLSASCAALFLGTVIAWQLGELIVALTFAVGGLIVIQNVGSTWVRKRGQRNAAAWVDQAATLIGGAVIVALVMIDPGPSMALSCLGFALVTVLAAVLSVGLLLRMKPTGLVEQLRWATRVGLPMAIAGAFAIWLGVGGRIAIGITSAQDLAAYSVAFRIAGLMLGVHQLVNTAFFPRLYTARVRPGDRSLALFMLAVLGVGLALDAIGPLLPYYVSFSALDSRGKDMYASLVSVNVVQTYFWIGFAMLQMRVNRFGAAKASLLPILLITVTGVLMIFGAARFISNDVRFVSWLVALHAAAYFATAWWLLARQRVPHRRMGLAGFGGGGILAAVSVLTQMQTGGPPA